MRESVMDLSVRAIIKKGKVVLEKPVSVPEGTPAMVRFLPKKAAQTHQEWLADFYDRTKGVVLDKQFEKNVQQARNVINRSKLPK